MAEWKYPMRISCAALCRIEYHGKYFLMINRNRKEKGIPNLSPVGGDIEVTNKALFTAMGAILENTTKNDLRMQIDGGRLDEFRKWFLTRAERETSPFRELQEELVLESGILPKLMEADVTCELRTTIEDSGLTNRSGQTGLMTQYFWEIFDVEFQSLDILQRLLRVTPEQGGAWLTELQITSKGEVALRSITG